MSSVRILPTRMVDKVWGRTDLPPPFAAPEGERIGEIWFEPPPELDALLVKYLFTSDKLSVQVHPADDQAPAGSRGKEECWFVLSADPDARLAIGFEREVSAEEMRAAALDGSIEQLLTWHPARAGDFFYIPAGTVHAIGPGLSLVEVQQNSDVTYRFYDYGRPRELHLEESVSVATGGPHPAQFRRHVASGESASLVDGPHFRLDRVVGRPDDAMASRYPGSLLVLPLAGEVAAAAENVPPGACALVNDFGALRFSDDAETLLVGGCA